jgi:hypothetical protein
MKRATLYTLRTPFRDNRAELRTLAARLGSCRFELMSLQGEITQLEFHLLQVFTLMIEVSQPPMTNLQNLEQFGGYRRFYCSLNILLSILWYLHRR